MSTYYITSTADSGEGTLRYLLENMRDGDIVQPDPVLFPAGTVCDITLSTSLPFGVDGVSIKGTQTRIVLKGAAITCGLCEWSDIDFVESALQVQIYKSSLNPLIFSRCRFVGCKAAEFIDIIGFDSSLNQNVFFNDCAFYGNKYSGSGTFYSAGSYRYYVNKFNLNRCTIGGNVFPNNVTLVNESTYYSTTDCVISDKDSEWRKPPEYTYDTWTSSSWESVDPRPSNSASFKTGRTSSSAIDILGKTRVNNGALGAFEYESYTQLEKPVPSVTSTTSSLTCSWPAIAHASSYTVYYKLSSASTWSSSTGITGTSKVLSSLSEGVTYQFYVVAVGSGNYANSANSSTVSGTTKTTLDQPTGLEIQRYLRNGSAALEANWTAVPNASSYAIQYKLSSASSWTTATSTTNSFELTGLPRGETYQFQIKACGSGNYVDSAYCSEVSVITFNPLPVPTNLSVSTTTSSLTATWTAVPNATNYGFRYKLSSASTWTTRYIASTSITISNLISGDVYDVQVYAYSTNSGYDASSTTSTVSGTIKTQLAAPTNVKVTPSTTSCSISWTAVTNADSYEIIRCNSSGSTVYATNTSTTTTSTFSSLSQGTTYYFKVVAIGSGNYVDSDYSSIVSGKTIIKLSTPTSLSLTRTTSSITASWSSVSNVSSYTIAYKLSTASSWSTTTSTTTSKTITGLTSGKTYDVKVMATTTTSGYVNSDYSDEVSAVVQTKLATPSVSATSTTSSITFSWSSISNASSYTVYYKLSTASTYSSTTTTSTSFSRTSLSEGVTYQCYVIATSSNSNYVSSSSSATVSGTTKTTLATPTGLSVSRTTSSLTASWTAVSNASSYSIQYKLSSASSWTTKTSSTNSLTLTGLAEGKTYQFQVKAVGTGNYVDSAYCSTVSQTTQITLDTPTGLTVTNNAVITTNAKSTVSWTAVDNVTSYKLEYKKSSATTWTSVSTTNVSYALTSLARNTSYDFRITAIGNGTAYVNSDVSSTVTKTTKSQLATPKNLTCTSKTATSLTFSWTAVSGTKTYYLGYKLPSSSSWDYVHPTTNSGTITGLSSGTTYNIRLSARTPTNSTTYDGSAYTSTINTTTLIPLTAPSNLNASNVTSTSAKVSWNSVNNATGYKVEFRKSGASSWLVADE